VSMLLAGEAGCEPEDAAPEDFGAGDEEDPAAFGVEPFPDDPLLCRFCRDAVLSDEIGATAAAEAVSASVMNETTLEIFIMMDSLTKEEREVRECESND
jgi:hypothetical protein